VVTLKKLHVRDQYLLEIKVGIRGPDICRSRLTKSLLLPESFVFSTIFKKEEDRLTSHRRTRYEVWLKKDTVEVALPQEVLYIYSIRQLGLPLDRSTVSYCFLVWFD
jgi:hypothetical protein